MDKSTGIKRETTKQVSDRKQIGRNMKTEGD